MFEDITDTKILAETMCSDSSYFVTIDKKILKSQKINELIKLFIQGIYCKKLFSYSSYNLSCSDNHLLLTVKSMLLTHLDLIYPFDIFKCVKVIIKTGHFFNSIFNHSYVM